ncbi:porin [Paraburkholderia sp. Ac-20347]|uniref:porin n=1 Tax=Paraburkholderia sp. Ac-20347 TaxID=2703892 RepID=UPI00197FCC09|nr:porin [Paraburkholderia sp. Ac-20347]MBN3814083.1 porin [Paraburkholderia sp. Ac-20347]
MKTTTWLGALTAALLSSHAFAQNSVTLYGMIDAGLMYTNNVSKSGNSGALVQATSGNINGSRFGIRGRESLGDGVTALFVLENGFNVQNGKLGQDNRLFGREAWVGLASDRYGFAAVGRQYDSVVDYVAPLSAEAGSFGKSSFAHPFDNDNLADSLRFSNAVKYASPNFAGLQFGGLYAFSNDTDFNENRAWSAGARYTQGPLSVGAGYLQIDRAGSTSTGAVDVSESSGNGVGGFTLSAAVQRVAAGAIRYASGGASLAFVYTHSEFEGSTAFGSAGGDVRFDNYELNGQYPLADHLSLGLAYVYTDGQVSQSRTYGSDPKWQQADAQLVYSFSKRTDVYLEGIYQHVSGHRYVAFIDTAGGASSTATQVVATVGLRTRF